MTGRRAHGRGLGLALAIGTASSGSVAGGEPTCFYLDKNKLDGSLAAVRLTSDTAGPVALREKGLFHGDERVCQWRRVVGGGVKEAFSLDGGVAVPILDKDCEAAFGHVETGIGFGDWYLTLCGTASGDRLTVPFRDAAYAVPFDQVDQWTAYEPGDFPVEGDPGH